MLPQPHVLLVSLYNSVSHSQKLRKEPDNRVLVTRSIGSTKMPFDMIEFFSGKAYVGECKL